jgi:hypothetical protein
LQESNKVDVPGMMAAASEEVTEILLRRRLTADVT